MICQTRSSYNWFLCFHSLDTYTSEFKLHLGIMATGAINVVRGSRSSAEELLLIYSHSNRLGNICFLSMFIYYSKDIYFRCEVQIWLSYNFFYWYCLTMVYKLWVICHCYYSVALVVDNPEMYNRVAESFDSRATVRFVVLLWGEKSNISKQVDELPIYCYKEIIDLGRQSNMALLSKDSSMCILTVHDIFFLTKFHGS